MMNKEYTYRIVTKWGTPHVTITRQGIIIRVGVPPSNSLFFNFLVN